MKGQWNMSKNAVFEKQYALKEHGSVQQKWLVSVMNRTGCNMCELAKKLHVSRQSVSCYMTMNARMSFPIIYTICCVTGIPDNAEKVYEAIKKDIKKGTAK